MNYWVQEGSLGGARQAVIHLGDCPLCDEGKNGAGQDRWYGPFDSLTSARDISDQLSGVAMRAECRCVRRVAAQPDLPTMALLNEPLFRRPEPPKEKPGAEKKAKKVAKTGAPNGKTRPSKIFHVAGYSFAGVAAVAILCVSLFAFPALSVVEAGNHAGSSTPFLLANDSPIPLTDLNAECTVELQPAAVRLQNVHQQLADRLGSKNQVTFPCFQASGGSVPSTTGITMHVTVKYAVFGIQHVEQTFLFVAARNTEGFCHWVQKG